VIGARASLPALNPAREFVVQFDFHNFCGKVCGDRAFGCYNFLTLQHFQQIALSSGI
jgi:hypothetical protein